MKKDLTKKLNEVKSKADKSKSNIIKRSEARISSAKTVIMQEAMGLLKLAESLDNITNQKAFIDTLHLIDKSIAKNGKIVFIGMGKPSYIAHKIAATMSSLGTPSIYVHAAETSHGDMGMITKNDVVICISNSGESREIFDVLDYCNKFKIPLIGMTRNKDGKLAKKSDVVLLIPDVPEACPMGKAPTVSTTQELALGDALCIVMAERIGMNPERYKHFHPGGKLGASVMSVKDFYNNKVNPIIVKHSDSYDILFKKLDGLHNDTLIAVIDNKNQLVGSVSSLDLLKNFTKSRDKSLKASDIMCEAMYVDLDCPLFEASKLLNDNNLSSCFIVKHKKPIGILYLNDLVKNAK